MEITMQAVCSHAQCVQLARMADEIWHEYWPCRIGKAQTDYMVEHFQSLEAIERDIRTGAYEYWFLCAGDDGRVVGYTGAREEADTNRLFISKIYLIAKERGQGFGTQVINFYKDLARCRGLCGLYLTVNKHNSLAIHTYKKNGFEIIDAVQTDIGKGFVMDDFIMEVRCDTTQ